MVGTYWLGIIHDYVKSVLFGLKRQFVGFISPMIIPDPSEGTWIHRDGNRMEFGAVANYT